MFWAGSLGDLEVRRKSDGSTRLAGRFPYGKPAVLSDGGRSGRPQKEVIEPRAFAYRIERASEDIHLLFGHSFDKPLASRAAGTLTLDDKAEALTFVASIAAEVAETSHGRDALALITSGLSVGISPGFRIPPKRAVEKAETVEEEPDRPEEGMHRAVIRRVHQALLYELSVVTRPAYPEAQVEARSWAVEVPAIAAPGNLAARRWRF